MLLTSENPAGQARAGLLERTTWYATIAAAVALVAAMLFLARGLNRHLLPATLISFAVGFALMRVQRAPFSLVALAVFIYPALCRLLIGSFYWPMHAVWMAAVLGGVLAVRPYNWCIPRAFASPVALWALSVALTAPIVAARAADFTFVTLESSATRNSGVPTTLVVASIVFLSAWTLTAILWFDRLLAVYGNRPWRAFEYEIVAPASAGWLISIAFGIYQWRVNLSFLSPGFWATLGRATGTILDANPFGAICAIWGVAVAGVALSVRRTFVAWLSTVVALAFSWAGVWASGSRSAFGALGFGTCVIGWISLTRISSTTARVASIVAVIGVMSGGLWMARSSGPMHRLEPLRTQMVNSPGRALRALWDRNGYGAASVSMIREHPWVGVGIGMFHNEVGNYSPASLRRRLPADNAQNWYRHQLSEFGIIGSVGWILWVALMAYALIRGPAGDVRPDVRAVRGALIAFGMISLVAMPGQDVTVGMMVMTLAFWYVHGSDMSFVRVTRMAASRFAWIAVWVVAIASMTLTLVASRDQRPPFRAAQLDNDYSYGAYFDGLLAVLTDAHAVVVPRSQKPWLKLTYWVEHPDAATQPVRVEIWRDHDRIVDRKLWNDVRVTKYVPVSGGGKRFVLEVKVDRTFRPPNDAREHGLNLKWEFVDSAPPGER